MTALGLQRADKRQIKFFAWSAEIFELSAGVSTFGSHGAPHCLMASIATCCHLSRLFSASSSSSCVTTRSVNSGTMRRAPSSTAFWMMFSMIFPLGTATSSVTGQGGAGMKFFSDTDKRDGLARVFNRAKEFIADAVQHGDQLAVFHAQDMQRVVRLASVQPQGGSGAMFGRQIKTVHWIFTICDFAIYDF